jgi:CPA1 family monovalent cation:H+ antiporter
MESPLGLMAILLTLAAVFGFINRFSFRLPNSIGVLVIALILSLAAVFAGWLMPAYHFWEVPQHLLGAVNLPSALMNGALSFLLFAGSLHVDLDQLWGSKWSVLALATFGVVIAVSLLSGGLWFIFHWLGRPVSFGWCVVLGAILAPTDPVSVVGLLKRLGLPPRLQAIFAGESLFNDGVAVVVFGVALGAVSGKGDAPTIAGIASTFVIQAFGGGALGLVTGWIALLMMRRVDEYNLELTISLALATGTYSLANALHMSGPIAVVVAALAMGSKRGRSAMSATTQRHVLTFWSLIDELLNTVLFLLIGFEIVAIRFNGKDLAAAALAIPLALAVRAISVFLPAIPLNMRRPNKLGALAVLTWGGLRGGISVALALSLPVSGPRAVLLTVCYAIVVFSIIIQGLTMERVVNRFYQIIPADQEPGAS